MERSFAGVLAIEPAAAARESGRGCERRSAATPQGTTSPSGPLSLAYSGGPPRRSPSRVTCLLDGVIHELDALARELGLPEGDPESILAGAYERCGEDLLERLRGSFVVIFWDPVTRRGIVARDQLGARSLFLHRSGRRLFLASELRDLLRLLPSRPGPDHLALLDWLARLKVPAGRTLHEGVHPLRPAHFLRLEEGGGEPRRYWEPRYRPRRSLSRSEAVEELRFELQRAAARQIGSDGSAGLMLSGGLDSSAIAAASLPVCRSQERLAANLLGRLPGPGLGRRVGADRHGHRGPRPGGGANDPARGQRARRRA